MLFFTGLTPAHNFRLNHSWRKPRSYNSVVQNVSTVRLAKTVRGC